MTIISPTPGRVVWFNPHPSDPCYGSDQPLAATVAYVHHDRLINIGFLDRDGRHHSRLKVVLVQDGDAPPEGQWKTAANHCVWMPYQKGQAAKAESMDAQMERMSKEAEAERLAGLKGCAQDEDAELARMIAEEEAQKNAGKSKVKGK